MARGEAGQAAPGAGRCREAAESHRAAGGGALLLPEGIARCAPGTRTSTSEAGAARCVPQEREAEGTLGLSGHPPLKERQLDVARGRG